jgi:hypothetical protein
MLDPLSRFEWASLHRLYDSKCKGYDAASRCLDRFSAHRPPSDRKLYYRLTDSYASPARAADTDVLGTYRALLYWKLYSTAGSRGSNILKWLAPESGRQQSVQSHLSRLLSEFPPSVDRDVDGIIQLIRDLPAIPGMGSGTECRLPVRTTFLHFVYPAIVPVFDKMGPGGGRSDGQGSESQLLGASRLHTVRMGVGRSLRSSIRRV